jgi:hypothetical protein
MPSRPGFQVAQSKEVAMNGKEAAKNKTVFLSKLPESGRIENGLGNDLLPDLTT